MLRKTTLKKINDWIEEGFEKRTNQQSKACCDSFLNAWAILKEHAPKKYKDFSLLVEKYNQGEDTYDWSAWIWEVLAELELIGQEDPECLAHRIEFIEAFLNRFPKTSDEELMEYLQRNLIKTHFLMGNDEAGEKAVANFYKKLDYSVWGYIEWGDALMKRNEQRNKATYQKILEIYKKGLNLEDDEAFLDILKERVAQIESKLG
jgi:hypothetical protein